MANKLETFLTTEKIDHRRLLITSRQLEKLRPSDRSIKLVQAQARKDEDAKKPEGLDKPRSGRPITPVGLRNAVSGKRVPGAQKTRILRAVNQILEQRKKAPVTLDALFELPVVVPKAEAEEKTDE